MPATRTPPESLRSPRSIRWAARPRLALWLAVAALLLALFGEAFRVLLGNNLHEVLPGRVYRSAQQNGAGLDKLAARYQIKTLINLRGMCDPESWYVEEARATQRLGISQEDVCFSANRMPSVTEIRRLIEILDRTEYPVLLHCRRGADRTGLASAIVHMLRPDVDLSSASKQLGLRYGHLSIGKTAQLDRFLGFYADWLAVKGLRHQPDHFRKWALEEYCPGPCRAELEALDLPGSWPVGKPLLFHVLCRNTAIEAWPLRAGSKAGVHLNCTAWGPDEHVCGGTKAGAFNANIEPGQSIVLALALPSFTRPGRHRLVIDFCDEQHCGFSQLGSEPIEAILSVEAESVTQDRSIRAAPGQIAIPLDAGKPPGARP